MSLLVGEFKNIVELTADCLPKLRLGPTSHVSSSTLRSFDSFESIQHLPTLIQLGSGFWKSCYSDCSMLDLLADTWQYILNVQQIAPKESCHGFQKQEQCREDDSQAVTTSKFLDCKGQLSKDLKHHQRCTPP
jgi:hypothetical protein